MISSFVHSSANDIISFFKVKWNSIVYFFVYLLIGIQADYINGLHIFYDFFCLLEVLGFELRACIAKQALYHLSHTPPTNPFCFSYFLDRSLCFYLEQASDCDPPTYASHVAGVTDAYHHSQWFVETGSC
jgi:hypothetical protein